MTKLINKLRNSINSFVSNQKKYPVVTAFGAGLYPLLHYFDSNLVMVNSYYHLLFSSLFFIIIPIISFYLADRFFSTNTFFGKYNRYTFSILNLCFFTFFIVFSNFGMQKKLLAVALLVAFVLAIVLYKHIKKIVVLQFLLALMVVIMFIPKFYSYKQQTDDWIKQPDDIENVEFKNLPNIYLIQPDGYANFSELKNELYRFDNSQFESFLNDKGFEFYEGFRSNYSSTIYTNSAIFGMKHHFYSFQENKNNHDFRKFIVSENPVLTIFKANSYKTHLLLEEPYFLLNRPKMGYDYTNIALADIPYFTNGFDMNMPIESELESLIKQNENSKNFYFLEKILPAHIIVPETSSRGVEGEREFYLEKLVKANQWLTQVVNTITSNDPNGLIVICADHGGFVGFKSTSNSNSKTEDSDLMNSVFSSVLAVKWPDNQAPNYAEDLKTSVNLFRVLFSYLSEDEKYLEYLQSNKSYLRIKKGAPGGIYEVIDNNGNVMFNKVSN